MKIELVSAPGSDNMIDCELICHTNCMHLNQIHAGFAMLAAEGRIRLRITRGSDYDRGAGTRAYIKARIETEGRSFVLGFDVRDSRTLIPEEVSECDFLAKRSYAPEYIAEHPDGDKIFPLGLSYPVYAPNDEWLRRWWWSFCADRSRLKSRAFQLLLQSSPLLSRLFRVNYGRSVRSVDQVQSGPILTDSPHILFLAQTWEPKLDASRVGMNEMRAECIRLLRREFGDRFIGGLKSEPYAVKHFPDCVAPDSLTSGGNYLKLLRASTICVATRGLKNSNGWKLAEYVAFSKCIVSERLAFDVPGGFRHGRHYLEFETPEQCMEAVTELMQNGEARDQMMAANHTYYQEYLRPDSLVWNALERVINREPSLVGATSSG